MERMCMSGESRDVQASKVNGAPRASPLDRPWWELVTRGVLFVVFGFLAIGLPDPAATELALIFGTLALFGGVILVAGSLPSRARNPLWVLLLINGLFIIILGGRALVRPDMDALVLLVLIGAWVLVDGVVQMVLGLRSVEAGPRRGLSVLGGAVGVGFGMLCLTWPDATALSIVYTIGLLAILFGLQLIVLGLLGPEVEDRTGAVASA